MTRDRERLLSLYARAVYPATLPDGAEVRLRVGAACPALDRFLDDALAARGLPLSHPGIGAAYLTAANPYATSLAPLSDAENAARNAALRAALAALGARVLPAPGAPDPDGGVYPPEPSFLALGLTRAEALALADRFGQLACVFLPRGGAATLLAGPPRPPEAHAAEVHAADATEASPPTAAPPTSPPPGAMPGDDAREDRT
jgi:hypothetical protein